MKRGGRSLGFNYVFSLLILALSGAVVFVMPIGFDSASKQYAAKSWPHTMGTVVRSSLRESDDVGTESDTMYNADVSVVYRVDGQRYRTYEIYFGQANAWDSSWNAVATTLRTYKKGSQVRVFYDPEQPEIATLEPGLKLWNYATLGLGFGLLCLGLVSLGFAVRNTYRYFAGAR